MKYQYKLYLLAFLLFTVFTQSGSKKAETEKKTKEETVAPLLLS